MKIICIKCKKPFWQDGQKRTCMNCKLVKEGPAVFIECRRRDFQNPIKQLIRLFNDEDMINQIPVQEIMEYEAKL
jgi:hypothetical protein